MTIIQKVESPGLQSEAVTNHTTNECKSSAKSTANEAQYERIVSMTRTGEKSTIDLRRGGVMMPAARIKEMNEKRGYEIKRVDRRDLYDDEGYCHPRVTVYALLSEPTPADGKRS